MLNQVLPFNSQNNVQSLFRIIWKEPTATLFHILLCITLQSNVYITIKMSCVFPPIRLSVNCTYVVRELF